MNRSEAANSLNRNKGQTLLLSGPALQELLQSVVQRGFPFRFKVGGFSMAPFIKDGDIVTVSPLGGVLPRIGDVVIFVHPINQNVVVHRVVAKKGTAYRVKGDNSRGIDIPLPLDNILGRLIKLERNGKRVLFGQGPERLLIARLARGGLFHRILFPFWQSVRSRFKKPSL